MREVGPMATSATLWDAAKPTTFRATYAITWKGNMMQLQYVLFANWLLYVLYCQSCQLL